MQGPALSLSLKGKARDAALELDIASLAEKEAENIAAPLSRTLETVDKNDTKFMLTHLLETSLTVTHKQVMWSLQERN